MSYAASYALQGAIYQLLRLDPVLAGLVGDAIFDAMPVDAPAGPHVAIGPEEVTEAGDATARGAQHDFTISVLSGSDEAAGFAGVKAVAVAVTDALENDELIMSRGRIAGLWFLRARARRVENSVARRVDLTFRALIDLG